MKSLLGQEALRRAQAEFGGSLTRTEKDRIAASPETGIEAVRRARKANKRRGIKFKKDQ